MCCRPRTEAYDHAPWVTVHSSAVPRSSTTDGLAPVVPALPTGPVSAVAGPSGSPRTNGQAARQHNAMSRKPVPSPTSWLAAGTPMISSAVTPTVPEMVTADVLSASSVAASAAVAAA